MTQHPFGCHLLDKNQLMRSHSSLVIHNNLVNRMASAGDSPPKFLTYQLDDRVLSYCGVDG